MNKLIIAYIAIVISLLIAIVIQRKSNEKIRLERDKYRSNTEFLLSETKHYKTIDSLNAVKVNVLELKLSEFERFRKKDYETINKLQIEKRELQSVAKAQTENINNLKGTIRDSIVYVDRVIIDTLKRIDIVQPYFELHGIIKGNEFVGKSITRDSLYIVSTIEFKRFLGFLWRTKKIKNREIDVVSMNENTKILGFEFVEIRK